MVQNLQSCSLPCRLHTAQAQLGHPSGDGLLPAGCPGGESENHCYRPEGSEPIGTEHLFYGRNRAASRLPRQRSRAKNTCNCSILQVRKPKLWAVKCLVLNHTASKTQVRFNFWAPGNFWGSTGMKSPTLKRYNCMTKVSIQQVKGIRNTTTVSLGESTECNNVNQTVRSKTIWRHLLPLCY